MLKRPLPRALRRHLGFCFALALVALGCYAVKSAQAQMPMRQSDGPLIALNVRWLFNDIEPLIMSGRVPNDALLRSGGMLRRGFKTPELGSNEFECTVKSSVNRSMSADASNTFLISCKLFKEGQVVATPVLLVRDGATAIVRSGTTGMVTTMEFNASSSVARVAAAREAIESTEKLAGIKRPPQESGPAPH